MGQWEGRHRPGPHILPTLSTRGRGLSGPRGTTDDCGDPPGVPVKSGRGPPGDTGLMKPPAQERGPLVRRWVRGAPSSAGLPDPMRGGSLPPFLAALLLVHTWPLGAPPPSLRPLQGRGSQHFWPPLRGVHRSPSNTTPVLPWDAHARGPGKPWHGPPLSLTHQATPSRHWDLPPSEMSSRLLSPPSWRLPWHLSSPTLQSRGHCSSESPAPPPRLAPLVPQPPTSDQESPTALKQKP